MGPGRAPIFIPIDGKTMRGSYQNADKSDMLHIVRAWASQQGITLGQVAVDSKSNEITAVPQLLEILELRGAIVSIDAMGCQGEIAAKIVHGNGDYVLQDKGNQSSFFVARCDRKIVCRCRQSRRHADESSPPHDSREVSWATGNATLLDDATAGVDDVVRQDVVETDLNRSRRS